MRRADAGQRSGRVRAGQQPARRAAPRPTSPILQNKIVLLPIFDRSGPDRHQRLVPRLRLRGVQDHRLLLRWPVQVEQPVRRQRPLHQRLLHPVRRAHRCLLLRLHRARPWVRGSSDWSDRGAEYHATSTAGRARGPRPARSRAPWCCSPTSEGADARALAGVRTTEVLVADQVIPEGTAADQLAALVRTEVLPQKAAVDGRVTDLDELAGLVATVDLQPGEQLLHVPVRRGRGGRRGRHRRRCRRACRRSACCSSRSARWAAGWRPATPSASSSRSATARRPARRTPSCTRSWSPQVQGAPTPVDPEAEPHEAAADDGETASSGASVPTQSLMITLAVSAAQAEAVVYGIEHGTLWLSLEPDGRRRPAARTSWTPATSTRRTSHEPRRSRRGRRGPRPPGQAGRRRRRPPAAAGPAAHRPGSAVRAAGRRRAARRPARSVRARRRTRC